MISPTLIRFKDEAEFGTPAPVGAPVGEPVAHYRIAARQAVFNEGSEAGVWECSPGRFLRQVAQAEYSYFMSGEGSFTPEGGTPIEFCAGDSIFFPKNTTGEWHIRQTVRKAYMILG